MRVLTPAVQTIISRKLGIEPVNILEVQWSELGGPWFLYADKDIGKNVDGKILSLSNLESVVKLDSQGQTQGISVTLTDSKGDLKDIFNVQDLHGKQCRLFQWFEGLPLTERFKLYEGEITSPIVWKEGDRSLSFEVITKLADKEIGFSPEEGYFEFLPEGAYGKPWPLAFGLVQNVPATRISEIPNTLTAESLNVVDPTLYERRDELRQIIQNFEGLLIFYAIAAGQAAFTCDFGDTPEQRSNGCSAEQQYVAVTGQISAQLNAAKAELTEVLATIAEQESKQNKTLLVLDGSNFPSGEVTLQSGDIILKGSFDGNTFNITDLNLTNFTGFEGDPFGFTWQREGTIITIQSDSPIVYVVNLLPTVVEFVSAFKQVENGKVLTAIPEDWYEVKTSDVGPYVITYITFIKPISSFDTAYDDDIFVTMTSPIGPNTVDIIEWLITTYTNMSIDTESFNIVKTKLENYPSHFALLERLNILQLLEDISFQARCAIWISGRTFFMKYLPEELDEDGVITESEIDAGSLVIRTSTTEEIVTKLVCSWTDDYANEEANLIILRHNVKKYGIKEREINFFIYNIFELVLKSATFWIIRLSNVWKHIDFVVFLDKLALETFDVVKFSFSANFVADTDIKGMLTSAVYDSNNKTIAMSAWLPVKTGTMERYDFAEPHDISIELLFPTQDEINNGSAGGDGPGTEVDGGIELSNSFKQESGFVSRSTRESQGERIQGRDFGELIPSDLDDIKPEPSFVSRNIFSTPRPEFSYQYPDYEVAAPDIDKDEEFSHCYPGIIQSKLSSDSYVVDVYRNGLGNDPTTTTVKQLQIASTETIPNRTWVMVAFNEWIEIVNDKEILFEEYTMQTPIWI